MEYPKYPNANTLSDDTEPTQAELTAIYDKYSRLGLYLAPKQSSTKMPDWYWWKKEYRHLRRNRDEALEHQEQINNAGWCVITGERSNRLLVIDIDPNDVRVNGNSPEQVYNEIQSMSSTQFVLRTPSNGVHLYYRIPTDKEMLTNDSPPIKGVDARGEGGQVVFVGGYNTYEGDYARNKGVPDGHRATYTELADGRYHEIPEMNDTLYSWLLGSKKDTKSKIESAKNYEQTPQGQAKLEYHLKQTFEAKERVVREALIATLADWDRDSSYDAWLQLWMSAHHGSVGSTKIRDIILFHPSLSWSDGDSGRQKFIETWASHEHQSTGYTIASLFYLARQSGWMLKTGLEIPDERVEKISVKYVQDWLDVQDTIPKRLLLQSQTGTGKTYNISTLWRRLGKPKTVIFVPTKKLAVELSQTLINKHNVPATLYRDMDTFDIREQQELLDAHVLVTTLQTFGSKLSPEMKNYGLVYIEEGDQLFSQFARGGGGFDTSHVTDTQARQGFAVLRDAFENSDTVWTVDATMSMVSLTVAEAMCDKVVKVVRNTKVRIKAPVEMLQEQNEAYQKVLEALLRNQRVVFVADTAREAEGISEIMTLVGALAGKKSIVITRNTEMHKDVRKFMQDVNGEAEKYALVAYNTVMASGVSIDEVTPDVVVQVCTYLPPRVNIQLLNRYREQKQVYVYYLDRQTIYTDTAEDVLDEIKQRAKLESQLSSMPISERVADASLRATVAAISVADTSRQWRSAQEFYGQLLREDGRVVIDVEAIPVMGRLAQSVKAVRKARKDRRDYVAKTWADVQPIDNNRPAPEGLTPLQIAQGEVHAEIETALRGKIPYHLDSEYVHDVALHFKKYGFIIHAFLNQDVAVRKAEVYLGDGGRSLGNLRNNVTLIKLLANVGQLHKDIDEALSYETVAERATEFNQAITLAKEAYNTVVRASKQKYDIVWERNDTPVKRALAFSKILLGQLGLKRRSIKVSVDGEKTTQYHIANLSEARDFIDWRNPKDKLTTLEDTQLSELLASRKEIYSIFSGFSTEKQQELLAAVDDFNDFPTVIKTEGELVW